MTKKINMLYYAISIVALLLVFLALSNSFREDFSSQILVVGDLNLVHTFEALRHNGMVPCLLTGIR